jgi:hypothetical protein
MLLSSIIIDSIRFIMIHAFLIIMPPLHNAVYRLLRFQIEGIVPPILILSIARISVNEGEAKRKPPID